MRFYDIIDRKKNKFELTREEIDFFVKSVTDGSAPDYQISALLMAIVLNGMTEKETFYLTSAMTESGEIMKKGNIRGICVDKHSTGGVSDSTTLVVVPVVCSAGLKFAKLSGRGLGHTGGTLDKLESFTGFNVNLSAEEFENTVNTVGAAISGQTENIDPADKKLYALRDVTATVDSIPLIASSIMSKKLASFADIIVLDVKYGSGAFMKKEADAEKLAEAMVDIGKRAGRKTAAVITSMEQPLGTDIGCNAEAAGAVRILKGEKNDLYEVSKILAVEILTLSGIEKDTAYKMFDNIITSGQALKKLKEIVSAQGGDVSLIDNPENFERGKFFCEAVAEKNGYLYSFDAEKIGLANVALGGGRKRKGDAVIHSCGINMKIRTGEKVEKGQAVAVLFSPDKDKLREGTDIFSKSYVIKDIKPEIPKLIYKIIE